MYSKNNNQDRDDSPAPSSSATKSPYNLRRNQTQPGAVTKRNNSAKSKKDISVVNVRTPSHDASPPLSLGISNQSQLSSTDDELLVDDNNTGNVEHSDDEQAALVARQQVQRAKTKPSSVWSHFDHVDGNVYMCRSCLKSIKTSNNTDANLRSHLGRAHQMTDVMFKSQRQQRTAKSNQINPEKKREYDEAALECIIMDGRPFGEFRRKGMSKFLSIICPGYSGPGRKTVRRRLGILYHKYREELCKALGRVKSIAITVNVWTKNHTSFICLTGHVFNSKYESVPIVLGFRQITGAHRADNIKKYILHELCELKIEDKVCAIVSDNGSDVKKAVNDLVPNRRFSCIAHDINLVVKNGLQLWNTPATKKKQTLPITTNASSDNRNAEDDTESELDRTDVPEELENDGDESEDGCSTDSDGKSNGEQSVDEAESNYISDNESEDSDSDQINDGQLRELQRIQLLARQLVKRVRACVEHVRRIRAINDYVKNQARSSTPVIKCNLITDFFIRWNTTFIMIDRFKDYRSIINKINSQPYKIPDITVPQQVKLGSKRFEFTNDDWFQINDLHTVLKPFFVSTNILSAKNYPTLAAAYSVQYAVRHFLSNPSENESTCLKRFRLCLLEKFDLYFNEKMEQHQKNATLIAAFLDPMEYCRLRERPIEMQNAITLLKIEMLKESDRISREAAVDDSINFITDQSSSMTLSTLNERKNTIESLFSLCGVQSSSAITPLVQKTWSIDEEIGFYVSSINANNGIKFSQFWSKQEDRLPMMSAVVRRFNVIPASSVPCESTFSVAGYIRRKQRCSLSATAIRYSLVLKDRHKLELLGQ